MPGTISRGAAEVRKTVLVVDDDSVVRAIAARMVEHLGYAALTASSVPEAITILEAAAHIDGVITDMVMPGQNGLVLVRWLRERRPELPVLVMTGYIPDDVLLEDLPGIRVLHKPARLDEFTRTLAAAMGDPVLEAG